MLYCDPVTLCSSEAVMAICDGPNGKLNNLQMSSSSGKAKNGTAKICIDFLS